MKSCALSPRRSLKSNRVRSKRAVRPALDGLEDRVVPAPQPHLVVISQPPASVQAGAPFGLTVAAEDQFGNLATGFNGAEGLVWAANPGKGPLAGPLVVTAKGGIATFSGLSLTTADAGYALGVFSGALAGATTSKFNVTPSTDQQDEALAQQVEKAVATDQPNTTPPPINSAQVQFLFDLATNAFYGPPQPPPQFAIDNLVNAANNGSVSPAVISQVLFEIAIVFDPPTLGGAPLTNTGPDSADSVGSVFRDLAAEATDAVIDHFADQLTNSIVTTITGDPDLGNRAGLFVGSFSGSVVRDAINGTIDGGSVAADALGGIIRAILG